MNFACTITCPEITPILFLLRDHMRLILHGAIANWFTVKLWFSLGPLNYYSLMARCWSFENVIKVSGRNVLVSFEMTHTLITTSTQRRVITIVCTKVKRSGRGTELLDYLHNSLRNLKQLYHHVRINSFFGIRTHQCLVQNNWKNQTLAS